VLRAGTIRKEAAVIAAVSVSTNKSVASENRRLRVFPPEWGTSFTVTGLPSILNSEIFERKKALLTSLSALSAEDTMVPHPLPPKG
jgi:hypothetical protein